MVCLWIFIEGQHAINPKDYLVTDLNCIKANKMKSGDLAIKNQNPYVTNIAISKVLIKYFMKQINPKAIMCTDHGEIESAWTNATVVRRYGS